jgi:uncharacterized protein
MRSKRKLRNKIILLNGGIAKNMKDIYTKKDLMAILRHYAADILDSNGMKREAGFTQHGAVSCYDHSVAVACESLKLALRLWLKVDVRAMVRGALLHDYFLYDWHDPDICPRFHGFTHAKAALENAERDFDLTDAEREIIKKHMFPLNPRPPRSRESLLVTLADKICASREIYNAIIPKFRLRRYRNGLY